MSFETSASCCPRDYASLQIIKKPNRFIGQSPLHKTVSEVRQRFTSGRYNRLQNQLSEAQGYIGVSFG